jgi:micrococcal nuclease
LYFYKATINKVVDGDTINLTIDLGFNTYWKSNCRLAHINTPELKSLDENIKKKAYEAKDYVANQLSNIKEVIIKCMSLDKYGRPVVEIYYGSEFKFHLNKELLDKGHAVKFM